MIKAVTPTASVRCVCAVPENDARRPRPISRANRSGVWLVPVVICCVALTAAVAKQQGHQLSASEKEHILDGQFKVVSTTEGIPANVKQAFSEITREPSFALANPGQKFQVTDAVVDRNLPIRRLVFAGVKADKWFVHYERGGRGHGYYVLVFKVDQHGDTRFVWGGSGPNGAKNLEQLRNMVDTGNLSDGENYHW